MKTKIFAAYLPQYHEIPENNKFWGEGFTDWVGVKMAKPQFEGHRQPRIPLNNNYYDLSDYRNIAWQASLAKTYGIDGFNIYHYWFKGNKPVLETPAKLILEHPEINISYFFSWDNTSWIRSWSNIGGNAWAPQFETSNTNGSEILLEHSYGSECEWVKHFEWLLPFFKDNRYYKIEGKPVFIVLAVDNKEILEQLYICWNKLALANGLLGVYMISGVGPFRNRHCLAAQFQYQPGGIWSKTQAINWRLGKIFHIKGISVKGSVIDYERAWHIILQQSRRLVKKHIFVSGLVDFDDTPRRGGKARIVKRGNPDFFYRYFKEFYKLNCENNMEFALLTAWNEWGEGAYLEPDTVYQYAYLEAVKKVLNDYRE